MINSGRPVVLLETFDAIHYTGAV